MHPAEELKKITSFLKQHLDEEEDLLPWEELLDPSVVAFYQQKSAVKIPKETKKIPEETKNNKTNQFQEIKKSRDIQSSHDLQEQKPLLVKTAAPIESPAEKKAPPPQPKVNHEMFKGLCQELFPDLRYVKPLQHHQPQVVVFSPPQAAEEIQQFLQKIGEAIKNKGIETLIASEPGAIDPLFPLKLIIVERCRNDLLPESTAIILPLDEIETLITNTEKKKLLWQQIRTILKI